MKKVKKTYSFFFAAFKRIKGSIPLSEKWKENIQPIELLAMLLGYKKHKNQSITKITEKCFTKKKFFVPFNLKK